MIIIAGLLKIYPFVLMVVTLRERPRVFLWVNTAAATIVLASGVYFHAEVIDSLRNIPIGGDFGAKLLPDFIAAKVVSEMHPWRATIVRLAIFLALFLAMAGWFFTMVRWRDFCASLIKLPEPEKMFLLIGTALVSGCFFAGSSIGYRGIHLLFTLPGLLAMTRMARNVRVRQVTVQGCVLVVALTWAGFFTWGGLFPRILASWIGSAPGLRLVQFLWFLSQIAWWQFAALSIAILIGCCSNWLEKTEVAPLFSQTKVAKDS